MRDTLRSLAHYGSPSGHEGPVRERPRRMKERLPIRKAPMKRSRKMGQFAGIGVYMQAAFLLLAGRAPS